MSMNTLAACDRIVTCVLTDLGVAPATRAASPSPAPRCACPPSRRSPAARPADGPCPRRTRRAAADRATAGRWSASSSRSRRPARCARRAGPPRSPRRARAPARAPRATTARAPRVRTERSASPAPSDGARNAPVRRVRRGGVGPGGCERLPSVITKAGSYQESRSPRKNPGFRGRSRRAGCATVVSWRRGSICRNFPCWWSTTSPTTWTRSASTSDAASSCCSRAAARRPWRWRASEDVAAIVTDQRMPKMNGLDLLKAAREVRPDAVGIIVTAFTDVDVLIEAINLGRIYRYVTKPWDSKELRGVLTHAVERFALVRENRRLAEQLSSYVGMLSNEEHGKFNFGAIVGESPALREVLARVEQVAQTSSTVLLRGETGTGKEMVARAIHINSARETRPFVRVNCAALAPGDAGVGAVRPREGIVHGRDGAPAGAVRDGRRRHAVPRRGRRPAARRAGQAAARAAGARVRAGRRQRDDQGRRARRLRDPPRSGEADRATARSARISTTG